jgi:SAM-dependent methyltransferase
VAARRVHRDRQLCGATIVEPEETTRSCPICGSGGGPTARIVDGWPLIGCSSCGFLYAPRVRASTATEIELPEDFEPIWRARHRQIHLLLTALLAAGELIVDVGAGFAELGRVAADAGRFRYVGFEPSASVGASARRRGVDVRIEMFGPRSLEEPAGAVVLDNVIEHVADPVRLLSDSAQALRIGGVLVVIVPNRFDIRQVVPSWRDANHWIPPEHINYFTHKCLTKLFGELGLTTHPFGFQGLGRRDWRYWPRATLEMVGLYPFGLNVYGVRR